MLKGILICFGFLIAQLFLLHYVDHRLNNSRTQVEYSQTNTTQAHLRHREGHSSRREDEKSDENGAV